jgi:hypothetical protein
MATWTSEEIQEIGAAEELELASLRGDGTLRKPVTIWVVRHGGDIYVRSIHGRDATWFRGLQERHEGRIEAGGVARDVRFEEADGATDELDAAYRAKYGHYAASILNTVLTPHARAATVKIVPRAS